jgi:predicted RNase H-like HicB family nuclease
MSKRVVQIKTWEDMQKEFGLDFFDDIACAEIFTRAMEEELPSDRLLEVEGDVEGVHPVFTWKASRGWSISSDMIEKVWSEGMSLDKVRKCLEREIDTEVKNEQDEETPSPIQELREKAEEKILYMIAEACTHEDLALAATSYKNFVDASRTADLLDTPAFLGLAEIQEFTCPE